MGRERGTGGGRGERKEGREEERGAGRWKADGKGKIQGGCGWGREEEVEGQCRGMPKEREGERGKGNKVEIPKKKGRGGGRAGVDAEGKREKARGIGKRRRGISGGR